MFALAMRSLRYRVGAFAASFLNVFLGAAILMAFASLLDTAGGAGVSAADRKTMTTMAWVVGGWGALIVAFGVAATLSLVVRQRSTELALLKSVGATPGQLGRLVVGEAAAVSAVSAVAAIPFAFLAGRAVLGALVSSHQIAHGTGYRFGALALAIGLGDTLVAAAVAAFVTAAQLVGAAPDQRLTARRAATMNTAQAVQSAGVERRRLGRGARRSGVQLAFVGRWRAVFGCVFLLVGADCGVLAATVLRDKGYVTESVAGEACIHTSIGLALFAPLLVRWVSAVLGPLVRGLGGPGGYLASLNMRQRTGQAAGVLMPVILFVGLATGSLYMQQLRNDAIAGAHLARSADEKSVETLNFIIVGMIAVFAAVVLVNIAIATTVNRRREFGRQRLVGSTPGQVRRMLAFETLVTVVTGVLFGTVGALASIVPYSIVLAHTPVPHVRPGIYLGVVGVAVALTFAANLLSGRRTVRVPALDAVAVNVGEL